MSRRRRLLKRGRKKLDRYAIKQDIYNFFFIAKGFGSLESMMLISRLVDNEKPVDKESKILFDEAEYQKIFDY